MSQRWRWGRVDLSRMADIAPYLERIRIAYAANFSLNAKTDHGRFDFDPVLFSRHVGETTEGDLVDENDPGLSILVS